MPALVERPKMSLAMWAALKRHIMKEREKKKQEQEADAAIQQLQRDQENRRKENAMTLEEIKEEIAHLEKKKQSLKVDKHEMFMYLKKVLYEDKRREEKEPSELLPLGHHFTNQNVPPVAASNLYMIAGNRGANRNQVMYKVGTVPTRQQNGIMKRQRSPSPTNDYSAYAFKSHVAAYAPSAYTLAHHSSQYPTQEQPKQHLPVSYQVPHMPTGYVGGIPQQLDHASPKPTNMQDEKYYIQAGGISAGYPVRTQPHSVTAPTPTHFQPPTSHSVTAPIQVPLRKEDVMRRNMNNESHR